MSDPDLEIRWGGGGRSPKNIFSALRVSVWSKNKQGAGPGPSPGSATVFKVTAFMYSSVYRMKISPHMNCLNLGFLPIIPFFLLWLASILM